MTLENCAFNPGGLKRTFDSPFPGNKIIGQISKLGSGSPELQRNFPYRKLEFKEWGSVPAIIMAKNGKNGLQKILPPTPRGLKRTSDFPFPGEQKSIGSNSNWKWISGCRETFPPKLEFKVRGSVPGHYYVE
ncbi:hypothetical protein CEXT_188641 [Caerostris extrusa]|uniref:Uncharacterized protein n=1 Tax=Caerostris extrusa TaxID=172846 RepID=A0AAV4RCA8_CAEEX|nr:hypothetical protein CEXT_188641 [Caerostris extrusa]